MEPFLKWAGGKSFLAPAIREIYLELGLSEVCEPFCGAGSVFLHIQAEKNTLSDNNAHLINLYNQIKHCGLDIDIDTSNTRENFLAIRAAFNEHVLNGTHLNNFCAQAFYYMNRTCFRGLCRFAKIKRNFNVGWGSYKKPIIKNSLKSYQDFFSNCTFLSGDFSLALSHVSKATLVFADPPYFNTFTGYTPDGFSLEDQTRLAELLGSTDAPIIATNSFNKEIIEIYQANGFSTFRYKAPRRISSDGNRDPEDEMIAIKNVPEAMFRRAMRKHQLSINIVRPKE